MPDAGLPNVGLPDASLPDAGLPNVGLPDASLPDAGLPDTGLPNVGLPDASLPDVGLPDTGLPDSTGLLGNTKLVEEAVAFLQREFSKRPDDGSLIGHQLEHNALSTTTLTETMLDLAEKRSWKGTSRWRAGQWML